MSQRDAASSYKIKRVNFFGREVQIFLQNLNGPCPLLAIANVLSLRNELKLPRDAPEVLESKLISLVAEHYLDSNSPADDKSEYALNLQQNLSDGLEVLHKLRTGIDVNVKFNSPSGFELTREVLIFDLLNISLLHGWLVDPQDEHTYKAFGDKSYNEVVEFLVSTEPSIGSPVALSPASKPDQLDQAREGLQVARVESIDEELKQALALSLAVDNAKPDETTPPEPLSSLEAAAPADEVICPSTGSALEEHSSVDTAAAVDSEVKEALEEVLHSVITGADENSPITAAAAPDVPDDSQPPSLSEHAVLQQAESLDEAASASNENITKPNVPTEAAPLLDTSPAISEEDQRQQLLIRNFLEVNCSQLTVYGLARICDTIKEHELAVFFRNNHFSTVFRHESQLYLLATDQGYLTEPDVVWERLDAVDGDTQLCSSDFAPFVPHVGEQQPIDTGEHVVDSDADFALALQLQEEERLRQEEHEQRRLQAQRRQQQQQQQQQQQSQHPQQQQQVRPAPARPGQTAQQQQQQQQQRPQPFGGRLIPLMRNPSQQQRDAARVGSASRDSDRNCTIM